MVKGRKILAKVQGVFGMAGRVVAVVAVAERLRGRAASSLMLQ